MLKLSLSSLVVFIGLVGYSQAGLGPNQHAGEIYHLDGTTTQGYLELGGSDQAPWARQFEVKFFLEEALADGKVKNKEKTKYSPKDIAGYRVGDKKWVSEKISAAKLELGIGLNKNQFMEVVIENDKISYYNLYEKPEDASPAYTEEQRIAREEYLRKLRENPTMVIINRQAENEYIVARKVVWSSYMKDCPDLLKRYETGEMGINAQDEGKSVAANLTSSYESDLKVVLVDLINEINTCN